MRITYFSSTILPSVKANAIHIVKMCSSFRKQGHDVRLYAYREKDIATIEQWYDINGVKIVGLPRFNFKYSGYISAVFMNVHNFMFGSDVIISRHPAAAWISSLVMKDTIFETHIPFGDYGKFTQKLIYSMIKREKLKKVIVITQSLSLRIKSEIDSVELHNKVEVLPDASDDYSCLLSVSSINKPSTKKKIGYIGSFFPGKGVDMVIELARKLREYEFHVVGGTPEEIENFKELYNLPNLFFYGYLPHEQAMKVAAGLDGMLLPNSDKVIVSGGKDIGQWTSPLKMFEYMSLKKVIFASDIPVLKEVLIHGCNSILCKADDIQDWSENIETVLNDDGRSLELSEKAYEQFIKYYTWDRRCEKMLS